MALLSRWKLKLLAILLAAVAWLVSAGRDYTAAEKEAKLKLVPPRDGVILLVGGKPYSNQLRFTVELFGPRNKIEMLADEALTAEYNFSDVSVDDIPEGQVWPVTVNLQAFRFSLENGTRLHPSVEIRPKMLEVKLDRVAGLPIEVESNLEYSADGRRKPVGPFPTENGCVDGYQIVKYYPMPRRAFVHGPASVLKEIDKVRTLPAQIGDLDRRLDRTVHIEPHVEHSEYGRVPIVCNEEIVISIEVGELLKSRVLEDVPVRLLVPYKFWPIVEIKTIDGEPVDPKDPRVDIEIQGPGVQISKILPEVHVRAVLDVTAGANPGPMEKPLTVRLPQGIRPAWESVPGGKPPVVTYEVKPTRTPE